MSTGHDGHDVSKQAIPIGFDSWYAYWTAQGMPWRTEPELDAERQRYLAERRAIIPDITQGLYPFKGITLDRADIEWLLATHESGGMQGPVEWRDPRQQQRRGLDLRGVTLAGVDLSALPLARTRFGAALAELPVLVPEQPEFDLVAITSIPDGLLAAVADLRGANLRHAHLEQADLPGAQLQLADLYEAHLEQAFLGAAHLEGATLVGTHLEGATLVLAHLEGPVGPFGVGALAHGAHFDGANLRLANLEGASLSTAVLDEADLRGAFLSARTGLNGTRLGSAHAGLEYLADARWGGASVALVQWVAPARLRRSQHKQIVSAGRSRKATRSVRLLQRERALRATRQMATLVRAQGLNDQADAFAYRAAQLQRQLLRAKGRWARACGSWLLDAVSGYGYRPLRSVGTYVLVVLGFAAAYLALTNTTLTPFLPSHASPLAWYEAVVLSISSFHGRGLFPPTLALSDPIAILAAGEAVIGLLIEITFIATFTQRFFAR